MQSVWVFFSWLDQTVPWPLRNHNNLLRLNGVNTERQEGGMGVLAGMIPPVASFFDPVTWQLLISLCPKSACVTNLHPGEHESAAYSRPRRIYSRTSRICLTSTGYIVKVVAVKALGGLYLTDG